jgi:hypothetical protein
MNSTPFQLPASLPQSVFVNEKLAFTQRESIAYCYGQQVQSYGGDTLAGQLCPGCKTLQWNDTTEVQSLSVEFFAQQLNQHEADGQAGQYPANFEAMLRANAGPNELWNKSYAALGLVPGVPGDITTIDTAEIGTGKAVRVILP